MAPQCVAEDPLGVMLHVPCYSVRGPGMTMLIDNPETQSNIEQGCPLALS